MPLLRKLKSCGGGSQMDLLPSKKCVIHNHLSTMVRLFDSLCDSNRQIKFKSSAQRVAEEGIPGSPKMSVLHEKVLKFKLLFASVFTDVFLFFLGNLQLNLHISAPRTSENISFYLVSRKSFTMYFTKAWNGLGILVPKCALSEPYGHAIPPQIMYPLGPLWLRKSSPPPEESTSRRNKICFSVCLIFS